MAALYGGPYKIEGKEGNEYFVCNHDGTNPPESNSVSDEINGLVKKANALEKFAPNSQVQPTMETQFSSILDHWPSIHGDGSQKYLMDRWGACLDERINQQCTRRKRRQSTPTKSSTTTISKQQGARNAGNLTKFH